MKNLFLTIAFVVSLSSTSQTTLNLSSGTQTSGFSDQVPVRSVEETSDGYIITYNFATANLMPDDIYTNTYNWEYNNFGVTHETTKPALPVRYEKFIVPEGKHATVSIISSQYRDYSLKLAPAEPLCIEGVTLTASDVPDISLYSGFYPTNLVSVVNNEMYRCVEIVTVGITPIQYKVQTQTVRAFTEIKFKVQFEDAGSLDSSGGNYENSIRLNFECQSGIGGGVSGSGSGDVIINPILMPNNTIVHKDYLILSIPEFENVVDDFCEWKKKLGFSTHVAYSNNWTTASINDSIYEYASTHPDFSHLLLFGDYDCLPSIEYHDGPAPYSKYHSDLSYACIVGNDDYPDVLYGRIPVNNITDANTVVQKIIKYEQKPINNTDFFNTLSFAALFYYEFIGNDNSVKESDMQYTRNCENIRTRLINKGYSSNYIYRLYPLSSEYNPMQWYNKETIPESLGRPQYNWNGNASDISAAINAGNSYVLYRGHGDVDCWWAEGPQFYTNSDIESLTNGSKIPIVFSITCQTGRLDDEYRTSFSETFLNKNNGGCAAIIAASNVSYTYDNNYLSDGIMMPYGPNPTQIRQFMN